MITLLVEENNPLSQETYNSLLNSIQFHQLTCSCGHSGYVRSLTADTESIGLESCTFVAESSNGFYAMDGNMRTVPYWDASGSYIGRLEDSDLFGTNYPWFCGSCMLDADTLLTVITEERPDKSADEAIVFTIKGF